MPNSLLNSFFAYSHKIVSIIAGNSQNPDFLCQWNNYMLESCVSNVRDVVQGVSGRLTCMSQADGASIQNANGASDAVAWLPAFSNAEAQDGGIEVLPTGRRILFTYTAQASLDNIQTTYLGTRANGMNYDIKLYQRYQYNWPKFIIPAGGTITQQITINSTYDMLVRSFVGFFPKLKIAAMIYDNSSGQNLMNTATMLDNFMYNLAGECNFRPRPFSPWIAQKGRTFEVSLTNLDPIADAEVLFSFWGNQATYTEHQ